MAEIEFHFEHGSGVAPYLQIVQQVRQAIRLGVLERGDQLPTVKQVAARLAINPNTVLKAYKELEHLGLTSGRQGLGTFVTATRPASMISDHTEVLHELEQWLAKARRAGLDDESLEALFRACLRRSPEQETA